MNAILEDATAARPAQPAQPAQRIQTLPAPTPSLLRNGQCLAWRPAVPGLQLKALHGRVWVTVEGDADDHVLMPGQSLALPAGLLAVAEAWHREGAVVTTSWA
jgi:hypothetical protein